nr:uncharacterized protein LOC113716246 [Coffea arabica]
MAFTKLLDQTRFIQAFALYKLLDSFGPLHRDGPPYTYRTSFLVEDSWNPVKPKSFFFFLDWGILDGALILRQKIFCYFILSLHGVLLNSLSIRSLWSLSQGRSMHPYRELAGFTVNYLIGVACGFGAVLAGSAIRRGWARRNMSSHRTGRSEGRDTSG